LLWKEKESDVEEFADFDNNGCNRSNIFDYRQASEDDTHILCEKYK
jgi:hypothetical protein